MTGQGNTIPVEIFATGDWAGLTWTEKELDEMVQNFTQLKDYIKPPVKLGHSSKQFFAQADGQPALGWVSGLRRNGNKLIADVADIPKVLKEIIAKGGYKRVSAEIYPRFERTVAGKNINANAMGSVLSALAFVGADVPEVKTLEDLGKVLAVENLQFSEPVEGTVTCTVQAGLAWEPLTDLSSAENPPKVIDTSNVIIVSEKPTTETRLVFNSDNTSNGEVIMPENKETSTVKDEMTVKFNELQAQLATLQAALNTQNEMISKQSETITVQSKTVEELQSAKQMSEQEIAKLTEEVNLSKQRESAAQAARLATEAMHFVEERSNRTNMKIMPSQREYARRLYAMLGDEDELITASEGAELKLFAEKEKAHALSPRECLKRLIDAWPGAESLAQEVSLHTEPKEESFGEALEKLMLTEKMDPASSEDRSRAVRLLIAKNPSLMPTYGSGNRY